jgi:hypothetical protein
MSRLSLFILLAVTTSDGSGHWDTVPYFIHCGNNSGGVSEPLLDLMAHAGFTVVQVQQGMDSGGFSCADEHDPARCNATGAEGKMAVLGAQIRARNPQARTVFYYTVDNVRVESDLGRYFLAHPELTLTRYDVDRRTGQLGAFSMYQYDFSQPAAVQAWAQGKAGNHSGVFIDGYQGWHECKPKPPRGAGGVGVGVGHLSGCPSEASSGLRTTVGNHTVNATKLLQGWWYHLRVTITTIRTLDIGYEMYLRFAVPMLMMMMTRSRYQTGPALAKLLPPDAILVAHSWLHWR